MKSLRCYSVIFLFLFSLSTVFGAQTRKQIELPDFAYPQDALKTAELLLKSKDGDERILGVMEYSYANKLIDYSSQPETMKYIEQLAAKETDPAVKSLLLLLAVKTGDNFKFNTSLCTAYAPEAKTTEEASTILSAALDSLTKEALRIAPQTPLENFYNVLDWSQIGLSVLPTVRDFVAYQVSAFTPESRDKILQSVKFGTPTYYAIKSLSSEFLTIDSIKPLLGKRDADYAVYSYLNRRRVYRTSAKPEVFKDYYKFLELAKQRSMGYWVEETVDSLLSYYNQPYFTFKFDKIGPRKGALKFNAYNLKATKVTFYRYLTTEDAHLALINKDYSSGKIAYEKDFSGESTPLGVLYTDSINLDPGHYVISFSDGIKSDNKLNGEVFTISPFIEIKLSDTDRRRPTVQLLDNSTGQPMKNVIILTGKTSGWEKTDIHLDKNGCFELPRPLRDYGVKFIVKDTGVEIISKINYVSGGETDHSNNDIIYSLTPDLPIYRPGEKARLTLVVSQDNKTLKGRKLKAKMTLPSLPGSSNSSKERRTIDLTFGETDEFGRSTAEIVIPEDCPLGNAVLSTKDGKNFLGSIKIAEFKLNDLKISNVSYKYTPDSIFVSGMTANTGGVSVGNVVITSNVNYVIDNDEEYEDVKINTVSNELGKFDFSFPRYWSANTKKDAITEENDEKYWSAHLSGNQADLNIEALSPNGRNASFYETVNLEYPNRIEVFLKNRIIDKTKGCNLPVTITGSEPSEEYIWKIIAPREKIIVASGTAKGTLNLNSSVLKSIEPGIYALTMETLDKSTAPYKDQITIYDTNNPVVPGDSPFLIPETDLTNRKNELLIGVKKNETYVWIYYGYFKKGSDSPIQKIEGHKLNKGWHRLPIDVGSWPGTYSSGSIQIYTLNNGSLYDKRLNVEPVTEPKLTLTCESFRDNVDADSELKWQLVTRLNDSPVSAAVYLNVMNSKLLPFGTIATPYLHHYYKYYSYGVYQPYYSRSSLEFNGLISPLVLKPSITLPEWRNLSDYMSRVRIRGVGSINQSNGYKEAVMKETAEDSDAGTPLEGYAAGMKVVGYGVIKENHSETAMNPSPALYGAQATQGNPEDLLALNGSDQFLRDPKVFTALWAPMLTTDDDGTVDVSFLVPGESTEWCVSARAWTRNLYSAFLSQKFTATRRLIVAPNPPRFVRVGDRVNLVTAITNNTDSTVTVTTSVVVKADSVSLVDNNSSITIESHATNYLTTPVNVEVTGGNLEYTVRVSDGVTGDGERNLIPVLPSSALVTESRNFYINPGQDEYSVTLPNAAGNDFSSELHYTTNPMWTVVESLPKAIEPWCEAASAVAMSVYSSRTALELSEKFADTKDVINLTDAKKYAEDGLKKLKKMQTANGGFKWGEWAKDADRYSTLIVLDWLASESDDPRVSELTKPALDYVDLTSVGKDGKVYPDFNYTVIRSFYGRPADQNGSRVVNKTINDMMNDWKSYSIDKKALAAIALKNYGYDKVAKTILGSLRQFGRQTPDRGFVFPNMPNILAYTHTLEAFASVEPKADIVSGIVQHLLYIRQGMDWGSSSLTTYAVRSIMEAASSWVVKPTPVAVRVDGQQIETRSEGAAGAISAPVKGRELTISRSVTEYPAYGAVVSTFIAPLTDIKPFSDGEVEITKTFVRVDKDGKETPLGIDAEVNPGEKLTVVLMVKSKRPLSNLVLSDMRPAAFEPVVQVPRMIWNFRSTSYYLENRDAVTNIYVDYIPAGTSQFTYEVTVNNTGTFTTGRATVASAIAPDLTAHSGSAPLTLKTK